MSGEPQYWLVAQSGVAAHGLAEYLQAGLWSSASPAAHAQRLRLMRGGDRIALKSTSTRRSGLPFFNADRPAPVMTIHAVGTVVAVDPDRGEVQIHWEPSAEPREWYLQTYVPALVRLDGAGQRLADTLIEFTFRGADQDLAGFLRTDPYWSARYPQPGFTWIPWYEEFATKLLVYRQDRGPLVQAIVAIAEGEPLLAKLLAARLSDGTTGAVRDLDPFTVFSFLSRALTLDNRQRLLAMFGQRFGIAAEIPDSFDGIPASPTRHPQFVGGERRRQPGDIDLLWTAYAAGLSLASHDDPAARDAFVLAFDAAQGVDGVAWNLTMGLYWCRPQEFPSLDSRAREFFKLIWDIEAVPGGQGYLRARDELRQRMAGGTTSIASFPLLAHAAYGGSDDADPEHTLSGFLTWGARLSQALDLAAIQEDALRPMGRVASAKQLIESGDAGWTQLFSQALRIAPDIDASLAADLRRAMGTAPAAVAALFQRVWSDPRPAAFDGLSQGLSSIVGPTSAGKTAALGALLLMAVDAEANAPYSEPLMERWHRLTGLDLQRDTQPSRQYAGLLAFLSTLADHLQEQMGRRPGPLETHCVAWATTEHDIPQDWPESQRRALAQWRSPAGEPGRAWLVRTRHASLADWVGHDYIALAAASLSDVPPGSDERTVRAAIESGYQHQDYAQRKALTSEYHCFLSRMKRGDLVAVPRDTTLQVGIIEGEAYYATASTDRLRRTVHWHAELDTAPEEGLRELLDLQGTVVDITQGRDLLTGMIGAKDDSDAGAAVPAPMPSEASTDSIPELPAVTPGLAQALHMPLAHVREIAELLQSRQQIVLYGPPGTGKTFLALALAKFLVGAADPSRAGLVQFHPSYSYEDFFEGFRPKETDGGQATFELQPGPLRRIASEAEANPGEPYVLVIDEMNRANLAKVFGELYFLLEYRKERIRLQYSPGEQFRLPRNLFLIGTMNTADRSIALLDAAMRRRFSFVELHPDEPPVRDVLANWLAANGHTGERAQLLQALNAAIEEQDRDLRIGPLYLMRAEAATQEGLARVWKYDIMPLLEEHYYGRLSRQQVQDRFGLAALLAGGDGEQAAPADELG